MTGQEVGGGGGGDVEILTNDVSITPSPKMGMLHFPTGE